jgi:hypothetical protein
MVPPLLHESDLRELLRQSRSDLRKLGAVDWRSRRPHGRRNSQGRNRVEGSLHHGLPLIAQNVGLVGASAAVPDLGRHQIDLVLAGQHHLTVLVVEQDDRLGYNLIAVLHGIGDLDVPVFREGNRSAGGLLVDAVFEAAVVLLGALVFQDELAVLVDFDVDAVESPVEVVAVLPVVGLAVHVVETAKDDGIAVLPVYAQEQDLRAVARYGVALRVLALAGGIGAVGLGAGVGDTTKEIKRGDVGVDLGDRSPVRAVTYQDVVLDDLLRDGTGIVRPVHGLDLAWTEAHVEERVAVVEDAGSVQVGRYYVHLSRLPRALGEVLLSPKWLQVGVVTSFKELLSIGQIETSEGALVVDVPDGGAPVVPGHARLELAFEMSLQLGDGAAEITNGGAGPT